MIQNSTNHTKHSTTPAKTEGAFVGNFAGFVGAASEQPLYSFCMPDIF
jgi:hypothetical protein